MLHEHTHTHTHTHAHTHRDGKLASVIQMGPCNIDTRESEGVCYDDSEWRDRLGRSCRDWSANPSWCSGFYNADADVPTIQIPSDFANIDGVDATTACCVCNKVKTVNPCPQIPMSAFHGANLFVDTLDATGNATIHQWGQNVGAMGTKGRIKSKIAQLRVYPKKLTQSQLLRIQKTSRWNRPVDPPAPRNPLHGYTREGMPRFYCNSIQKINYQDAKSECKKQGMSLAFVDHMYMDIIKRSCPPGEYFIGADDLSSEGVFKWYDGSRLPLDSPIWRKGEPNDFGEVGEDCVKVDTKTGQVFDARCGDRSPYICMDPIALPKTYADAVLSCASLNKTLAKVSDVTSRNLTEWEFRVGYTPLSWIGANSSATGEWKWLHGNCPLAKMPKVMPRYHCQSTSLSYVDAKSECESKGMTLAMVASDFDLNVLRANCTEGEYFVGADDRLAEGNWKWLLDGSSVLSSRWQAGQPNEGQGEDCAVLDTRSGKMKDVPCESRSSYVCQQLPAKQIEKSKCLGFFPTENFVGVAVDCEAKLPYVCQDFHTPVTEYADVEVGDMKQCKDPSSDGQYGDTSEIDDHGRLCSWYSRMSKTQKEVCFSSSAKKMCPMTCQFYRECNLGSHLPKGIPEWVDETASGISGRDCHKSSIPSRECVFPFIYEGKPYSTCTTYNWTLPWCATTSNFDTDPAGRWEECKCDLVEKTISKYRIFDRVMHLRPNGNNKTLICPAKSLNVDDILAECENKVKESESKDFADILAQSWKGFDRADLRLCDEIRERLSLETQQCAWDDSWIPKFLFDVNTNKGFSLSFWSKPTPTSRGMPREFVNSVNFFEQLAPAKTLFDIMEGHPYLEAVTRLIMPNTDSRTSLVNPTISAEIQHKSSVSFTDQWTFYYASFRKIRESDIWTQYLTDVEMQPPSGSGFGTKFIKVKGRCQSDNLYSVYKETRKVLEGIQVANHTECWQTCTTKFGRNVVAIQMEDVLGLMQCTCQLESCNRLQCSDTYLDILVRSDITIPEDCGKVMDGGN